MELSIWVDNPKSATSSFADGKTKVQRVELSSCMAHPWRNQNKWDENPSTVADLVGKKNLIKG